MCLCLDMRMAACADRYIDMRTDSGVHQCMGVYRGMHVGVWIDMYTGMCTDMCMDMCRHTCIQMNNKFNY